MRVFFNATFKSNPYLERGLITGITRVSKELIFSDMNNLRVVSITSKRYAEYFGFTEEEVFASMDEYGLIDKADVKRWYDGYILGNQKDIYNPWSIINYLSEQEFAPYWVNTASNVRVGDLFVRASAIVKNEAIALLQGESIVTKLDENIAFNQLYTIAGTIWSLLMAAGYLKVLQFDRVQETYELTLTNYEVKLLLHKLFSGWNPLTTKNDFLQALLTDDIKKMNKSLQRVATGTISYFDPCKEPELFYHGFMLGLVADLEGRYKISSNRESDYDCYDVTLFPLCHGDHGIVLEFKARDIDDEKNLEDTCSMTLQQIWILLRT